MKCKNYILFGLMGLFFIILNSCKEDAIYGVVTNEQVKVYLPFRVFSVIDKGTAVLDTVNKTVNFPLSVLLGGSSKHEPFTVDVSFDNTFNQVKLDSLIQVGALPANTVLMPSDMCKIETKDTVKYLNYMTIGQIVPKIYVDSISNFYGKIVALSVKISNPSKFELNAEQSSTVLYFNVEDLLYSGAFPITIVPVNTIINPGFNDSPYSNGWTQTGDGWGTEGGVTGNCLHYWTGTFPANGSTLQTVINLDNGRYKVSIYYKLAGQNIYLYANGEQKPLVANAYTAWTKLDLDFKVTDHTATFGIKVINSPNSGNWEPYFNVDDVSLTFKKI